MKHKEQAKHHFASLPEETDCTLEMSSVEQSVNNIYDPVVLYYNNINGLQSKLDSLKSIITVKQPDIIALCETKLSNKSNITLDGYEVLMSNLKYGKEGILLAAKVGTFRSFEVIYQSENRNLASFELVYPEEIFRVIVAHAPQENVKQSVKTEFYEELETEIRRCYFGNIKFVIAGDLNAKITEKNNRNDNAKLFHQLIENQQLEVLNYIDVAEGFWTRLQRRGQSEVRSVLDYLIADVESSKLTSAISIDENKMYTPYRIAKKKSKPQIVFSDHCAIIATFMISKGGKLAKPKVTKTKAWHITPEGLTKYQELTKHPIGSIDDSSQVEPYEQWFFLMERVMKQCFKKITKKVKSSTIFKPKYKSDKIRVVLKKVAAYGRIQRKVVSEYIKYLLEKDARIICRKRALSVMKTVNSLSENDKLSTTAFWKLKKSTKRNSQLTLQKVQLNNGTITSDPERIKTEVEKEFQNRLSNRKPHPEWEEYVDTTNEIVKLLMEKRAEESDPFSMNELCSVIKLLKSGTAPGCDGINTDLITCGGSGVLVPLLQVLNIIKKTKRIPTKWNDVDITLLYKNKGTKSDLTNYRGIFLTIIVSKIFEKLLLLRMSPHLKNVSLYQAGSRKNRSVADNLFLLRGCMDYSNYLKQPLYLTTYDFKQAFDSLWLEDSLLSLEKVGVDLDLLQLIHALNKEAKVTIKTPHGPAGPFLVSDLVKQGGILGPIICSTSTGEYCHEGIGFPVGTLLIESLAFVDDIADININPDNADAAHMKALTFAARKKLSHSVDKCLLLIQNEKRGVSPPQLVIDDVVMKIVDIIKYLGDLFNKQGNNKDLIEDRVKRGIQAKTGIIAFLKENNCGIHSISVSLLLYHSIFVGSVLFNCQAWSNLTSQDLKKLNTLQCSFLKKLLNIRRSTSNSFVLLELGVLPIESEIHLRQLSFLHHIINLPEEDPVKKLFRMMESLPEYPNWLYGVKILLRTYSINLTEEQIKNMSKHSYKKLVKKAVSDLSFENLKKECTSKSKTKGIIFSEFKLQQYLQVLPPKLSKIVLQARSRTLDLKCHSSFMFEDVVCRLCGENEEDLPHVLDCGAKLPIGIDVEGTLNSPSNPNSLRVIALRLQAFFESIPD